MSSLQKFLRAGVLFRDELSALIGKSIRGSDPETIPPPALCQLESRVLYSASPAAGAAMDGSDSQADNGDLSSVKSGQELFMGQDGASDFASVESSDAQTTINQETLILESPGEGEDGGPLIVESPADARVRQLVFIDAAAASYEQLVDDIRGRFGTSDGWEVVVLENDRDGIEQISEVLDRHSGLEAVHVVSHGTAGAVKLGGTWLSDRNLDAYAGNIARWGDSLATDADILLYGCDLAANDAGQSLVESLAVLTGADVAASTDPTGAANLGGDWNLEYAIGEVETPVAPSDGLRHDWQGLLAPFIVTTTSNSGAGSLRQAILDANALPGLDTITFNILDSASGHYYYQDDSIAGSLSNVQFTTLADAAILDFDPDYPYAQHSWFRIDLNPASGPLNITSPVLINGYSQPGATVNNSAVGQNANLRIELTSTGADGDNGLDFLTGASGSTVRGLAINGFDFAGIRTDPGVNGGIIQGNFIGTDITGTIDLGNGDSGILLQSNNNLVGGSNPADRNVVSGNSYSGVSVAYSGADDNQILGNYIGVDASATGALGNSVFGVVIWDGASTNQIGDVTPGAGNIIAYNNRGVVVDANPTASMFNSIRGNSIHSNTVLGIDLNNNGVTVNDSGDGDTGPNGMHNYPVLTSATVSGTDVTVAGTLDTLPSLFHQVDFYWSPVGDPSGHGEAQTYIGSTNVTTDGSGNASFNANFVGASVPFGVVITATTTDQFGNTSEFAQNVLATSTAQLSAAQDTYIRSSATTLNYGNSTSLIVDRSGGGLGSQRPLLQFDLSAIPVGATITGATLNMEATQNTGAFSINVYEVTQAWIEGNGNGTAAAANWNESSPGTNWSTSGGSVNATPVATLNTGAIGQHRWDLTTLVQDWFAGTTTNNGILIGSTDTGTTTITYDSSEGVTPPQLVVNYLAPVNTTPVITNNGGGATVAISVPENTTAVTTVAAADADVPAQTLTYSISSGADAAKFAINTSTGELNFLTAPDFETPTDVGGNNIYDVTVQVSDGTLIDTQAITVTVSDVANNLIVTTTVDTLDGNTSSIEALIANKGSDGFISLREAIIAANNTVGADAIAIPVGTFAFTIAGDGEDLSATGDLDITDSVTILGASLGLSVIDANGLDRVFHIHGGTVAMSDLTIQGGVTPAPDWGAGLLIDNSATLNLSRVEVSNNNAGSGAGIYNHGTLTAVDSAITDNVADDWGGGLYNDRGNVTIERVTISGNSAGKDGGGIENIGVGAAMSLLNVTISNNTATDDGGGLWTNRAVTATSVTIAFNTATAGDGLFGQGGSGTVGLKNSLLHNPAGSNSNKVLTSLGYNLDSDGSAGLADPSDINNVDPLLNTLQNNGGVGATHALQPVSAAINAGTVTGTPIVDQRNVARDANPDIGAFEFVFAGNLPPTITSHGGGNSASINVAENSTTITTSTATDPDLPAQILTFSINGGADAAKFMIDGSNGVVSFISAPNFESPTDAGTDNVYEVTVQVTDGTLIDTQYLTVTVTNLNEVPIAADDVYSATEDTALAVLAAGVLGNDSDPEGNLITAVLVTNTTNGRLSLNADGAFVYSPNANFSGIDSFTYRATDGSLSSGVATVTINVAAGRDFDTTTAFRVNTTTSSNQETSAQGRGSHQAVALQTNGDYVVVWSSNSQDGDGWGVYGRRFAADGSALSGEFLVNQTTIGDQQWAYVSTDASGEFVVVWSSPDVSNEGVFARRFDAAGTPLGNEFQVNTFTSGRQHAATVAMQPDGGFIIVWDGPGPGDTGGVFARRYNSSGTALDATEFRVNTDITSNDQNDPMIATDAAGNFVIAWDDISGVHFRRFQADGTPLSAQTTVDGDTEAGDGAIGVDAFGNFVIAWRDTSSGDGNGTGVLARRYDSNGVAIGASFVVNATTTNNQTNPSVAMDQAGNFLIVWEGEGPGDSLGVFAQKYDAAGNSIGSEFRINQTTSNTQHMASAAMIDLDNFVVVWSGDGPGDTSGVFARQFGSATAAIPHTSTGPTIDSLLDGAWSTAQAYNITLVNAGSVSGASDLSGTWRSLWDSTHLYFLVTVTDNALVNDSGLAWHDDEVEIYIDADNSQGTSYDGVNDFQYIFRYNDPGVVHFGMNSVNDDTGVTFSLVPSGTNYVCEVAIPWTTLGVVPSGSVQIGVDVQVGDDDDGGSRDAKKSWNVPTDTAHFDPSTLGAGLLGPMSNQPPTNLSLSNSTEAENTDTTGGHSVGVLTTTDPDALDTFSYSIVGGSDAAAFSIGGAGTDELILTDGVLDFETQPAYQVIVRVTDLANNTHDQSFTINVFNVNEPPVIVLASSSQTYTEQGTPIPIDSSLTINDVDSVSLTGARVTITNGYLPGTDELTFTPVAGIVGSFDSATDVLTFTGTALVSDYETLLRSVRFHDPSDTPFVSTRSIIFQVSDGTTAGNAARDVQVVAVNDPPTLNVANPNITYIEDSPPLVIDAGLLVSDVDNSLLSGAIVRISANFQSAQDELSFTPFGPISGGYNSLTGVLTLTGSGTPSEYQAVLRTVAYRNTSNAPNIAPRTITFDVSDGFAMTSDARVVLVQATNDSPVAVDDGYLVNEDTILSESPAGVLSNDSDADGNVLTAILVSGPANGVVTLNLNGSFDYTPNPGFNGFDSFTYVANDGTVNSNVATVVISVNPVNDPPSVSLIAVVTSLAEDTDTTNPIVVANVLITDDGIGSNSLSLSGSDAAAFEIVAGQLRLKAGAALNFETNVSLNVTVAVDDSAVGTAPDDVAPFNLSILDVGEPPISTGIADVVMLEDSAVRLLDLSLVFSDPDTNNSLRFSVEFVSNPSLLAVIEVVPGTSLLKLVPAADQFGSSFVTVRATDSAGLWVEDSFQVTVLPVNDVLQAVDQLFVMVASLLNDDSLPVETDVDGDILTVIVVDPPEAGTFTMQPNGQFEFQSDGTFDDVVFSYQIWDGSEASNTAYVTIQVLPLAIGSPPPEDPGSRSDPPPTTEEPSPRLDIPGDGDSIPGPPVGSNPSTPTASRRGSASNESLLVGPPATTEFSIPGVSRVVDAIGITASIFSGEGRFRSESESLIAVTEQIVEGVFRVNITPVEALLHIANPGALWKQLDEFQNEVNPGVQLEGIVVGTVGTVASTFTVGYVLWAIRSGILLSSLLASMPAWKLFDPLVVTQFADNQEDDDDDSLEQIVEEQSRKIETTEHEAVT